MHILPFGVKRVPSLFLRTSSPAIPNAGGVFPWGTVSFCADLDRKDFFSRLWEFDRLALARAKFAFGNFVARSEWAVIPLTFLSRGSVIIPGVFWWRSAHLFHQKIHTYICAYIVYVCFHIHTHIWSHVLAYMLIQMFMYGFQLCWPGQYWATSDRAVLITLVDLLFRRSSFTVSTYNEDPPE